MDNGGDQFEVFMQGSKVMVTETHPSSCQEEQQSSFFSALSSSARSLVSNNNTNINSNSPQRNNNSSHVVISPGSSPASSSNRMMMMTMNPDQQHVNTSHCLSDHDSDDDDSDDSSMEGELTWRDDPTRSLSDWTLYVSVANHSKDVDGEQQVTAYHVHKSVLAVGPRRSNYFSRAFSRGSSSNNSDVASDMTPRSNANDSMMSMTDGSHSTHHRNNYQQQQQQQQQQQIATPNRVYNQQQKQQQSQSQQHIPHSPTDVFSVGPPSSSAISSSSPHHLNDIFDLRQCTTRIQLDRLAAQAVPIVLDYLYSSTGQLDIETNNATALHALSSIWEIKALRKKVRDYWQSDLNMENIITYYGHARIFSDAKILQACQEYCAKHIFEVGEQAVVEILSAIDPLFFLRVVTSPIMQHQMVTVPSSNKSPTTSPNRVNNNKDKNGSSVVRFKHKHESKENEDDDSSKDKNDSNKKDATATTTTMVVDHQAPLRLSLLIAVYGNIHRTELTPSLFFRLTAATHLPTVEVKAAKVLLELENDICGNADGMTSLKERSIAVLSQNWLYACFIPNPDSLNAASNNHPSTTTTTTTTTTTITTNNKDGGQVAPPTTKMTTTRSLDVNVMEQDVVVSLPRLSGRALENFTALALENARQRIVKLQQEIQPLVAFRQERQGEIDVETKLRQELAIVRERCAQALQDKECLEKTLTSQVDLVTRKAQKEVETCQSDAKLAMERLQKKNLQTVEDLIREKEALAQGFLAEMDQLRLQTRQELDSCQDQTKKARVELEQAYEKCLAQNVRLQTEVNDLRKEMAKQKDLAKLRKVANSGPGTMLKQNKKSSSSSSSSVSAIPAITKQDSM